MNEEYQIKSLINNKNYDVWKKEMIDLLSMNKCINIIRNSELRLSNALIESMNTSETEEKEVIISVYIVTRHDTERWENKTNKFIERQINWDDRHLRSTFRIFLSCVSDSRVYIKDIIDVVKMWKTLKNRYDISNLVTRNKTFIQLKTV